MRKLISPLLLTGSYRALRTEVGHENTDLILEMGHQAQKLLYWRVSYRRFHCDQF